MIPLVEDYLSELIQGRFESIRANPNKLSSILAVSPERLDELGTYLKDNPVSIRKGYPRTPAELPCICVMLSAEQETPEGLGDHSDYEDHDIRNSVVTVQAMLDDGSFYAMVPNVPLNHVNSVVNITTGHALELEDFYVSSENTGMVGFTDFAQLQEGDSLSIDYNFIHSSTNGIQTLFECNYRLEAWSLNGDLTVDLYHLTKYALLWGRSNLISDHGIIQQRLSGSDFEPATSYFPEFVYRRALSFWCQFTTAVPTDEDTYLQGITVTQNEVIVDGSGL